MAVLWNSASLAYVTDELASLMSGRLPILPYPDGLCCAPVHDSVDLYGDSIPALW